MGCLLPTSPLLHTLCSQCGTVLNGRIIRLRLDTVQAYSVGPSGGGMQIRRDSSGSTPSHLPFHGNLVDYSDAHIILEKPLVVVFIRCSVTTDSALVIRIHCHQILKLFMLVCNMCNLHGGKGLLQLVPSLV